MISGCKAASNKKQRCSYAANKSQRSRDLHLIFIVCACLAGVAQQNPQRLILKDGSFQTVTKYEVQGQRVRYYSAERYSWEELPSDMVDWPATEKFNKDRNDIRTQEVLKAVRADRGGRA